MTPGARDLRRAIEWTLAPIMNSLFVVVFAAIFLVGSLRAQTQPGTNPRPTQTKPGPGPRGPVAAQAALSQGLVSEGMSALQANQPRQALQDFQQALHFDPNDATANLLASTAAVELFEGQQAVQYAERARQLDPQNWKIHTTLVAAYAAAGMKAQRDRERALLRQMHQNGPPDAREANGFLLEMFPVGAWRVDAVEYFEPMGRFHTRDRFLVRQADGTRIWEIDVESDDFDQRSWAAAHETQAAAGGRQYQLTGRGTVGQEVDYRMFSGSPDYDAIRAMVVGILETHGVPGAR